MRKVEVLRDDNKFHEIPFGRLVKGDKFRLFEPWGALIMNDDGGTVFTAYSDPEMDEHYGVWRIKTKETSDIESSTTKGSLMRIQFLEETVEQLEKENELLKNKLHILNSWMNDIVEPGC